MIQSRTISKIHYTITSPFRGSRDGVVSAKEKDEETSYSYFGARYLASDFSFWLSVDPMADKYPNISPYAYCAWNPVMLVDPDGREIDPYTSNRLSTFRKYISQTPMGKVTWNQMLKSPVKISINDTSSVIIDRTGNNGDFVLEGAFTYNIDANGKISDGTVNVSEGTYNLEQALIGMYNVGNLSDLNNDQKSQGLQTLLSSGIYNIIDAFGNTISSSTVNINGTNPDAGFISISSMNNESYSEYMQRVTGHEGTHPVTSNGNKPNNPGFNNRQEKDAYRREGIIIKQIENIRKTKGDEWQGNKQLFL